MSKARWHESNFVLSKNVNYQFFLRKTLDALDANLQSKNGMKM